jgi:glycosyltransferase involved in cell wall biosynthesis
MKVSVVIPTLNAGKEFGRLLDAIASQDFGNPFEIIVVDSGSTDGTIETAGNSSLVRLIEITDFTHGRSRNIGATAAKGNFLVFMTQDCLPANKHWLVNLLKPFSDGKVAAAFSRQTPFSDANPMEQYFLANNFSKERVVRQLNGKKEPGIFDVFFSNVSSAIRRDVWEEFPFDEKIIMSEDQSFARQALLAGHKTVYEPDSVVFHSHNYGLIKLFQRYFDSLYSLYEIFGSSLDEIIHTGVRYTVSEQKYIWRNHKRWIPYYVLYYASKAGGSLFGKYAHLLPRRLCRTMSMHKYYWDGEKR